MMSRSSFGSVDPASIPLIGRDRELSVLQATLERTFAGEGRLVLMGGEPGIGKTRLVEEIASQAAEQDALVFWGRCYEWEGMPAYWPWDQVLGDLVERAGTESVCNELDTTLGHLLQGLPSLADRVTAELPENALASKDPGRARFEFYLGVQRLIRLAARSQPLVFILEDLHWAGEPALLLLEFMSQEINDSSVLILGTYRNEEHEMGRALTTVLPTLRRGRRTQELILTGLDLPDSTQLISHLAGGPLHDTLAGEIHGRSRGNPLFVRELTFWFQNRGHDAGTTGPISQDALEIPEGILAVIGRRVDRTSEECQDVLAAAAVIGERFPMPLLQSVMADFSERLLDHLDEARSIGLIEEGSGVGEYRFRHALVRDVVYRQMTASRRATLHGRVAAVLEEHHAGNLAPVYGDLAQHFARVLDAEERFKAIDYARLAGDRAASQFAWELAADYHQLAVDLYESQPAQDPSKLCELLLELAEAWNLVSAGSSWAGKVKVLRTDAVSAGLEVSWRAVQAARLANAPELLARATLAVVGVNPFVPRAGPEGMALLQEALSTLSDEDSPLRAMLLSRLGSETWQLMHRGALPWSADDIEMANQASDAAVEMARRLDDPATIFQTLYARSTTRLTPDFWEGELAISEERLAIARHSGDPFLLALALLAYYATLFGMGRTDNAERLLPEMERVVDQLQLAYLDWGLLALKVGRANRAGRFAEAEELLDRADSIDAAADASLWRRFGILREQGRVAEIADQIENLYASQHPRPVLTEIFCAVCLLETGRRDGAYRIYQRVMKEELARLPDLARHLALLAELCIDFDDSDGANALYDRLIHYEQLPAHTLGTDDVGASVAHHLGELAALLGRWDVAERHFQTALDLQRQWQMPTATAYTHYAWARMLPRRAHRDDRGTAAQHIERSRAIAEELTMSRLLGLLDRLDSSSEYMDATPAGLSAREIDVLRLIVEGWSNQEIADELFISPHTVANHVAHIFNKIGVDSRTSAATWALTHNVV